MVGWTGETGYLAGLACCRVDLDLALCGVGVEEGEDMSEDYAADLEGEGEEVTRWVVWVTKPFMA